MSFYCTAVFLEGIVNRPYVIAAFDPRPKGRLVCYFPSDQKGVLYIDRESNERVVPGVRYLCKIVKTLPSGVRFVHVVTAVEQIIAELSELCVRGDWERGKGVTGPIHATITTSTYGEVKAEWYETTGEYRTKALYLNFRMGISKIKLACDHTDPNVDLDRLAERVHACTGAHHDLVDVIARPRPWHRYKGML